MTRVEMSVILDNIRYKRGWYLRTALNFKEERPFIQWTFKAPDYELSDTPVKLWFCRKHYLSEHMTEGEIVQTAFMAALQAEEHECREAFSYEGKRLFNPHIDVRALMSVADQIKGRG